MRINARVRHLGAAWLSSRANEITAFLSVQHNNHRHHSAVLNRLHPRPHSRRPKERKFKLCLARLIELAPLQPWLPFPERFVSSPSCFFPHVAPCELPFSDALLENTEHYFKFTTYCLCGFVYVCVQIVYSHELLDVCANMKPLWACSLTTSATQKSRTHLKTKAVLQKHLAIKRDVANISYLPRCLLSAHKALVSWSPTANLVERLMARLQESVCAHLWENWDSYIRSYLFLLSCFLFSCYSQ